MEIKVPAVMESLATLIPPNPNIIPRVNNIKRPIKGFKIEYKIACFNPNL